jgi:hypothetical protein
MPHISLGELMVCGAIPISIISLKMKIGIHGINGKKAEKTAQKTSFILDPV